MSSLQKKREDYQRKCDVSPRYLPAFYYDLDRTCFPSFPLKFPLTTKSVLLPHRFLRHFPELPDPAWLYFWKSS